MRRDYTEKEPDPPRLQRPGQPQHITEIGVELRATGFESHALAHQQFGIREIASSLADEAEKMQSRGTARRPCQNAATDRFCLRQVVLAQQLVRSLQLQFRSAALR